MVPQPRSVTCPNCGSAVVWSAASRWRPFCSERCKLLDLSAWASERYSIPVAAPSDEDAPDLPASAGFEREG